MNKEAILQETYDSVFNDELEKISEANYDDLTKKMSDALYTSQKRIDRERISRGRKKLLGAAAGVGVLGGAAYGATKLNLYSKHLKPKVHSVAEKVGREVGETAGKATNAAAASYGTTVKSGVANTVEKFRGGKFVNKIIRKVLMKGK